MKIRFVDILEYWKYNILVYNTGTHALPDIYTLTLEHCAPSGIVHIYIKQSTHACVITITCNTFIPQIKAKCQSIYLILH